MSSSVATRHNIQASLTILLSLLRRLQIPVNTNVLDETDVKNEMNDCNTNVLDETDIKNEMNVKDVMNVPNEMNVLNEFHARAWVSFSLWFSLKYRSSVILGGERESPANKYLDFCVVKSEDISHSFICNFAFYDV